MPKITEIIPDDLPDWAKEAMDAGKFFAVVAAKVTMIEKRFAAFGDIAEVERISIDRSEWYDAD